MADIRTKSCLQFRKAKPGGVFRSHSQRAPSLDRLLLPVFNHQERGQRKGQRDQRSHRHQ
jgi:hypothetical protein